LAILAVAGVFTACNSGSDETKTGDSTPAVDTMTVQQPVQVDTVKVDTGANKTAADTSKKAK